MENVDSGQADDDLDSRDSDHKTERTSMKDLGMMQNPFACAIWEYDDNEIK